MAGSGAKQERLLRRRGRGCEFDLVIWVSIPLRKNISSFHLTQIISLFRAIPSRVRDVSRSSRTLGWDAVDAAASSRELNAGQAFH